MDLTGDKTQDPRLPHPSELEAQSAVDSLVSRLISDKPGGPWTRNSLRHAADELRNRAWNCRRKYTHPSVGPGAKYLAKAYEDAADVLQRALDAISSDG